MNARAAWPELVEMKEARQVWPREMVAAAASIGVGHCTLSSTGTRFRRRWHVGALPLRARLVLCHGTHEHSGRYDDLAAACCAKGIECFAKSG